MDETQIKQIIERQPLHGTALLDPRCKILLLVCIGFVSYFLAGEMGRKNDNNLYRCGLS